MGNLLERFFKLKENHTNFRTEVVAGITTFMTMAYILAVNPSMLSATGMDSSSVFAATAWASFVGTMLMAIFANYPFALAPGMGLNAFFAYTVVLGMGYSWQFALTAVLVEGIIFVILSLTNVREAIFNAIPNTLKLAVSAGIGLFIAFIGLQNAKIVVADTSTCVSFFDFGSAPFKTVGITVVLAMVGIIITAIFMIKKVKGGILLGILSTWILGIICQLCGFYVPDAELGFYSLIPDFSNGLSIPSMSPTFCKFEFSNILSLDFIVIMFSFLFVDMFDTLGTLIGVSSKANMLDEDGKLPRIKGALLADSIATIAGACFGTSTTTTYVESASGVASGGRTGLSSVVTGLLFLLSLLFSPIFLAIPSFATAPALIVVGFMMLSSILKINFEDYTEAIPAYICIIAMPFMYSISDGICFGIISYVLINALSGKAKKVHPLLWILAILFVLKYALL
jgi:AGZA family xanthine/uracil permease-like MFS transporter